jgi:peptidoglycan hydrolase-like protein with peptidoglycan-binding domain
MALQSEILSGNQRLDDAAAGGPSIKKRPPDDDPEAVKKIQRALVELGHPLPVSFGSGGPDGVFGNETFNAVMAYQKKVFPGQWAEWDGRVGQKTLAMMDQQLPKAKPVDNGGAVGARMMRTTSRCLDTSPTVAVVATLLKLPGQPGSIGAPKLPGRAA